jgi:tRNA A-37 threonylcarbamoyl transferase component Bud32
MLVKPTFSVDFGMSPRVMSYCSVGKMPSEARISAVQQTIGKYVIQRLLGSGAMGTVYLGYYALLDRLAAIKVMKTGLEDEVLRNRFFREGRSAAKLDHPNIIKVWDLDTDANNRPYIAMEYVEGEDLSTYIKNPADFFLSFDQKLRVVVDVCRGLHHAHSKGIIHRDVKPGNIRISRDGEAKILDFGLAKIASADKSLTGGVLGTPYYMSPEQWRGLSDLDCRSDLFSLAAVLYELITYVRAFESDSVSGVMNRILKESHVPLKSVLPGCASDLSDIVDRALAKDRGQRFANCEEFALELEQFLTTLPNFQRDALEEVETVRTEFDRCQRKSQEPGLQEFLQDVDIFELPPEYSAVPADRASDYGLLLLERVHLHERVEQMTRQLQTALPLMRLLQEGKRQLQEGQLDSCQKTVQQLLAANPQSRSALNLRESCKQALAERHQQEELRSRLRTTLSQASDAVEQGHLERAAQIINTVLEADPMNPDAPHLLEKMRNREKVLAEERNRRISEVLQKCHKSFSDGEYTAAYAASEELVRLSAPVNLQTGRIK